MLTNEGLLSPGGYQNVYTTNITGNLTQTATGIYGMDLDLEPSNDLINVTGTANMAGQVFVNLINPLTAPGFAIPGTHTPLILSRGWRRDQFGLNLTAFDTAVIHYSLIYPNPTDIDLKYVIDYSPAGLTLNQHSVGNVINAIQTQQVSPAFRPIATNLFYLPSASVLGATYNSLSGEGVSATEQTAFDATSLYQSTINTQTQRWISDVCGDDPTSKSLYAGLPTKKGQPVPIAPCANPRSWRIWGTGFASSSNWPGDPTIGSAAVQSHSSGFAADSTIRSIRICFSACRRAEARPASACRTAGPGGRSTRGMDRSTAPGATRTSMCPASSRTVRLTTTNTAAP